MIGFNGRRRKIEAKISASWGRSKEKRRNFDRISRYAAINQDAFFHRLTDQTLSDIDIEELFACIDRTETGIGQQYLFYKIVHPVNATEALKKDRRLAAHFSSDASLRKRTQYHLYRLEQNGTYFIVDLFDPDRKVEQEHPVYKTLALAAITLTVFTFFIPSLFSLLVFLFFVNILLHFIHRNRSQDRIQTVSAAFATIDCAEKLLDPEMPFENKAAVNAAISKVKTIRSLYRFLGAPTASDDFSMILMLLFELIKGFFLIEPLALNKSYRLAMQNRDAFEVIYKFIGTIDTAISCASLINDQNYTTCTPEFADHEKQLWFSKAYHPLIENPIPGSFHTEGSNIFITGSNMSGKSTFLRTVLINSVLAQTIYICFAERFCTPFFKQYSAIKIADNLFEQESYFYKEMKVIREMVEQLGEPSDHLFLIDEIYKGTNTVERMALALSVLRYLNGSKNLIMASSHDLELVEYLKGVYKMYHFAESIQEDKLVFDYRIKEGAVQSRNAIQLAALEQYPSPVIEQAMVYAKQFASGAH